MVLPVKCLFIGQNYVHIHDVNMSVHSHGHMKSFSPLSLLLLHVKSFVFTHVLYTYDIVCNTQKQKSSLRESINFANYSSIAVTTFCHLNNHQRSTINFPTHLFFSCSMVLRNLMGGKFFSFTRTIKSYSKLTEKIVTFFID